MEVKMETNAHANCAHDVPRAERIARLNDGLRKSGVGGRVMITRGVRMLADFDPAELVRALADYDDFDALNDPHGERDFGAFDLWGAELMWKVDYYAPGLLLGSDDPADPDATQRVLTVLLAAEY
jgi:hypothetical protein